MLKINTLTNISLSKKLFFTSSLGFIFVLLFSDIASYIWSPPQGIHFSRQMDSFAFSYYYFIENTGLFTPGNLNLESAGGRCASEFPIIYYIASITYNFFGVNFLSLKIITILLLFIGFYYSVRIIFLFSQSLVLSNFLSILFFSSTVLIYYGTLYLPDVHSFGFALISLYYFFKFYFKPNERDLFILYFFITLSSLIKASFYYYECTFLVMIYLISRKNGLKLGKNIILFLISTALIFSWYAYAKFYNQLNAAWYYTTSPKPFWEYSEEMILKAIYFITEYWYSKYYFQSTWHFILITLLVGLVVIRKNKLMLKLFFLLVCFNILYVCLFLKQFIDHDYYFIVMIPSIIVIVSVCFCEIMKRINNRIVTSLIYTVVIVMSVLSLNYAKLNMHRRYFNNFDTYSASRFQIFGVNQFIDSLAVSKKATFIVVGDKSQNGSLVFLNRFGWVYSNFKTDTTRLKTNLNNANYLLVLKPSENVIPKDILFGLKNCEKYSYYSNHIYSLKNYAK